MDRLLLKVHSRALCAAVERLLRKHFYQQIHSTFTQTNIAHSFGQLQSWPFRQILTSNTKISSFSTVNNPCSCYSLLSLTLCSYSSSRHRQSGNTIDSFAGIRAKVTLGQELYSLMHKTPPELCTCTHLAPCEFLLQPSLMICSKMKKCVGLWRCVWMTREAKLGKLSFWQQLNKTRQKAFPGKQEVDLSSHFARRRHFALKIICVIYRKIFCWSDGRGIQYVSVSVMLSKGNRTPQWQVARRANGRPRQIKSNSHLSCWQLKSHLSNYSWCQALRSNQSFQQRNKWCEARDHGLL